MPRKTTPDATAPRRFRVLTGMDYVSTETGKPVRAEPGDVVADIPAQSLDWLIAGSHIEEVE